MTISKILKDKGEELNPALARSGSEEGSADMCGDREISPSRPASARRGPKAEVIEIELKFLSWRGNRRLSKPARIRLLSVRELGLKLHPRQDAYTRFMFPSIL